MCCVHAGGRAVLDAIEKNLAVRSVACALSACWSLRCRDNGTGCWLRSSPSVTWSHRVQPLRGTATPPAAASGMSWSTRAATWACAPAIVCGKLRSGLASCATRLCGRHCARPSPATSTWSRTTPLGGSTQRLSPCKSRDAQGFRHGLAQSWNDIYLFIYTVDLHSCQASTIAILFRAPRTRR